MAEELVAKLTLAARLGALHQGWPATDWLTDLPSLHDKQALRPTPSRTPPETEFPDSARASSSSSVSVTETPPPQLQPPLLEKPAASRGVESHHATPRGPCRPSRAVPCRAVPCPQVGPREPERGSTRAQRARGGEAAQSDGAEPALQLGRPAHSPAEGRKPGVRAPQTEAARRATAPGDGRAQAGGGGGKFALAPLGEVAAGRKFPRGPLWRRLCRGRVSREGPSARKPTPGRFREGRGGALGVSASTHRLSRHSQGASRKAATRRAPERTQSRRTVVIKLLPARCLPASQPLGPQATSNVKPIPAGPRTHRRRQTQLGPHGIPPRPPPRGLTSDPDLDLAPGSSRPARGRSHLQARLDSHWPCCEPCPCTDTRRQRPGGPRAPPVKDGQTDRQTSHFSSSPSTTDTQVPQGCAGLDPAPNGLSRWAPRSHALAIRALRAEPRSAPSIRGLDSGPEPPPPPREVRAWGLGGRPLTPWLGSLHGDSAALGKLPAAWDSLTRPSSLPRSPKARPARPAVCGSPLPACLPACRLPPWAPAYRPISSPPEPEADLTGRAPAIRPVYTTRPLAGSSSELCLGRSRQARRRKGARAGGAREPGDHEKDWTLSLLSTPGTGPKESSAQTDATGGSPAGWTGQDRAGGRPARAGPDWTELDRTGRSWNGLAQAGSDRSERSRPGSGPGKGEGEETAWTGLELDSPRSRAGGASSRAKRGFVPSLGSRPGGPGTGDVTLRHLQLGPLTPQGKRGVQAELPNAGAWGISDTPKGEGSNPRICLDFLSPPWSPTDPEATRQTEPQIGSPPSPGPGELSRRCRDTAGRELHNRVQPKRPRGAGPGAPRKQPQGVPRSPRPPSWVGGTESIRLHRDQEEGAVPEKNEGGPLGLGFAGVNPKMARARAAAPVRQRRPTETETEAEAEAEAEARRGKWEGREAPRMRRAPLARVREGGAGTRVGVHVRPEPAAPPSPPAPTLIGRRGTDVTGGRAR
ncbi:collagen alpha-1(V) chain-like [Suncus etruscus]|uniref:collagen alpha-1(V) chain-like n=1 Tax=Suncus etruscus TaxID=109475 RepID=UPI00210FC54C|nr:collagen alpha-1(V) chain-like [Suncus etruscus]